MDTSDRIPVYQIERDIKKLSASHKANIDFIQREIRFHHKAIATAEGAIKVLEQRAASAIVDFDKAYSELSKRLNDARNQEREEKQLLKDPQRSALERTRSPKDASLNASERVSTAIRDMTRKYSDAPAE